jgi:Gpi18-like mannosyltransferase
MSLEAYKKYTYDFFPLFLLLGLVLRILLSPYLTYEWDFKTWKAWAYGISKVGFSEFYDRYWCDYMPGYLYVLWVLQKIHVSFPHFSDEVLFKLPANIADLGIAILIFSALKRFTDSVDASLWAILYFFNPASLSNSTLWGQVDSFHVFPLLLSVLLVVQGRFVSSSVLAATAFMIKPQSIVIFPVIGFFTLRDIMRGKREDGVVLKTFILGVEVLSGLIITALLITLPFIWDELAKDGVISIFKGPVLFIKERFYVAYNQYKYTSLNAFNFWSMFHGMWKSDEVRFIGITYQRWGTIVFGVFYALIFGFLFLFEVREGKYLGVQNLKPSQKLMSSSVYATYTFSAVTLIFFSLFLFLTRVHERHFLPAIAFFTLIAFRSRMYWSLYALISVIYTVNLLYAYLEYFPIWGFSSSLIKPYIPVMVITLFIVFLVVLVDFMRNHIWIRRIS